IPRNSARWLVQPHSHCKGDVYSREREVGDSFSLGSPRKRASRQKGEGKDEGSVDWKLAIRNLRSNQVFLGVRNRRHHKKRERDKSYQIGGGNKMAQEGGPSSLTKQWRQLKRS